ncbi:MAG: hypothetical protein NVSMB38_17090 [Ktedonobacteraceae bacterium]
MHTFFTIPLRCTMLALLFLFSTPAIPSNNGKPARSETLTAGPYTIIVGLSDDPPIVDQNFTITVSSHEATPLAGTLVAQPGPGTDAIPAHTPLTSDKGHTHVLTGTMHLVVRGVWHIFVNLNGPRGHGSASLDVTVAAPGAIPVWLGWMIGLLPLFGGIGLIWQQWQYRNSLLKVEQEKRAVSH